MEQIKFGDVINDCEDLLAMRPEAKLYTQHNRAMNLDKKVL